MSKELLDFKQTINVEFEKLSEMVKDSNITIKDQEMPSVQTNGVPEVCGGHKGSETPKGNNGNVRRGTQRRL